jgi:hypothetical protein
VADLTVDQPRRLEVWRVGYKPEPWAWVGWEKWATDGRFRGRWDDSDGIFRTVYAGSTLLACLLELLANFRPDPLMVQVLDDIDEDDEDAAMYPSAPAGVLDPSWLDPRAAGTGKLSGRFCAATTSDSLAALHPHFVGLALHRGVSERPKENASKAFVGANPPRVQNPPPPPSESELDSVSGSLSSSARRTEQNSTQDPEATNLPTVR